jgi:hypothetical protein
MIGMPLAVECWQHGGGQPQFCEHYHGERNHQGMGNKIIEPDLSSEGDGAVICRERLGGQLRYYYRDAA